jgi:thiamine-phosphate pyrophosphorylase
MAANAPRSVARRECGERLAGIYVILNEGPGLLELARAVFDAGIRLVQYRAKGGIVPKSLGVLRAMASECSALLILNDNWRAAIDFDCDGVHLGPGDDGFDRVAAVRTALGDRLVGLSCGTRDEVNAANACDVDYLGIGSVYATLSKSDAGAPIGIDGLRALVAASTFPAAAIGGLTATTILQVRESGAAMAAVISAISDAADPRAAARELLEQWHR